MKYINTIEELDKYKGQFVLFYYTKNGKIDGNVKYAWAKKITRIVRNNHFKDMSHPIGHHYVYGTDTIIFKSVFFENGLCTKKGKKTPYYKSRKEESSNAQEFARELTITEKLICRILLKKQEAIEKGLIKKNM